MASWQLASSNLAVLLGTARLEEANLNELLG